MMAELYYPAAICWIVPYSAGSIGRRRNSAAKMEIMKDWEIKQPGGVTSQESWNPGDIPEIQLEVRNSILVRNLAETRKYEKVGCQEQNQLRWAEKH